MRGINKVILIGDIIQPPVFKENPEGSAFATILLATTETWTDKHTGNKKSQTEYHRVIFFGKLAGIVNQFASKGAQAFVSGKIHTRKYIDKQSGLEKESREVQGLEFLMLSPKKPLEEASGNVEQPDLINEEW